MTTQRSVVQPITLAGRLAAVVADGQAVIRNGLGASDEQTVKAMCLFAMEIHAGEVEGPYSEARALAFARRAMGRRAAAGTVPRGRRR